ncbi:group III truncated hemoglobin [Ramlibacter tataouinensis]|uniref:group III truncated hemoglobin n=1 Tax=Ramlibacter tataouinensis TaxID=94132 RepID=UPI0022F3816A|nr:group III truncated hemoglobin [Ramlibacter tataouinensis]WBY03816.1 group III truncated hemoglobin [Ramlibacter tataouinensis]
MPSPDLCTEDEVQRLVHDFYAKVRQDPLLGPVFDAHIQDWTPHLARMVDFWSSALRGTARFRGTPMPKHVALPELNPELFRRWLSLFAATTAALGNPALQQRADELAHRIADSLWYGWRLSRGMSVAGGLA